MIHDSGNRREFDTGAVRDTQRGKGRCDLLPLDVVADVMEDGIILGIYQYTQTRDEDHIVTAIDTFIGDGFDSYETQAELAHWMLEVSIHFEQGASKYRERNWEAGIPLSCYVDSGVRHYLKYLRGDEDERHDRAFLWNMLCLVWTARHKPHMDNLSTKPSCDMSDVEMLRKYKQQSDELYGR